MLPFDFHSHHRRCGHALGEIDDYVAAAHAAGLQWFGVSDHGPAWWFDADHALPRTQMAKSEFGNYLDQAREIAERWRSRINVLVGVEADWIDGRAGELTTVLDRPGIDYVLGSVHYSGGVNIFRKDRWDTDNAEEVFRDYYRQVADCARSGLFDILSHLTAVEAYAPLPSPSLADELYTPVADAIAESGCIVEINTSGYRKRPEIDEPFPNRRMLRLLIERGVPLTFGSDCHQPGEVGYASEAVRALLLELDIDPAVKDCEVAVRRNPLRAWRTD
jgi:histidinol-phosphatase (PHP family)